VDEAAVRAITAYYGKALPEDGVVLDLMSSWRSHLPEGFRKRKLVGQGMNAVELAENPQLDERVAHDLNADPTLPFADGTFDAAVVTVSVQYLTNPLAVFREVNRVLKPGASFHVVFSNRCFPTKAVAIWQRLDDEGHAELVASYFHHSGGWAPPEALDISPRLGQPSDPVYVVRGRRT
jgi:SAM-dependent methyltransferase